MAPDLKRVVLCSIYQNCQIKSCLLQIKAAKAAILANYGPDRSWFELLTCDLYEGDRLAGILEIADKEGNDIYEVPGSKSIDKPDQEAKT